jgi:hypothetical protein
MIVSAFTTVPTGKLSATLENVCLISVPPNKKRNKYQLLTRKVLTLWDTGAFRSVISEKVAQELRLEPTGKELIYNANSRRLRTASSTTPPDIKFFPKCHPMQDWNASMTKDNIPF